MEQQMGKDRGQDWYRAQMRPGAGRRWPLIQRTTIKVRSEMIEHAQANVTGGTSPTMMSMNRNEQPNVVAHRTTCAMSRGRS